MTQTYSRDNLASLRTDDNDLTTMFASPADYNAVASLDGTTVDQSGSNGYAVFNFKDTAAGKGVTVTWKGQSTKAPSESKAQLQIYKRTGTGAPVWEDVSGASNNAANANENFTITGTVADLTNYADESNPVACRVYQAASAPPAGLAVIQSAKAGGTVSNQIAFTFDDAPTEGNLLIAFTAHSLNGASRVMSPPNGNWVKVEDLAAGWNAYDVMTIWRYVVQNGDGTTHTFSISDTNYLCSGVIYEIQGANAIPLNQEDIIDRYGSGQNRTPVLTPSVLGCLAIGALSVSSGDNTNPPTYSSITSGWTEQQTVDTGQLYLLIYSASKDDLTSDTVTVIYSDTTITNGYTAVSALVLIAPA